MGKVFITNEGKNHVIKSYDKSCGYKDLYMEMMNLTIVDKLENR